MLCVTVILLPVGIPLVQLAGRLFRLSVHLMLPRTLVDPIHELTKATDKRAHKMSSAASDAAGHAGKKGRKLGTSVSDTVGTTVADRSPARSWSRETALSRSSHAARLTAVHNNVVSPLARHVCHIGEGRANGGISWVFGATDVV